MKIPKALDSCVKAKLSSADTKRHKLVSYVLNICKVENDFLAKLKFFEV